MFVLSMPGTEQNVQMGRKSSNRYLGLSDRVYKWQSISLLCMTWQWSRKQNRMGQAIITTPIMFTLRSSHVHLGNNIQTFKINVEY